jgi:hypothetical protein
MSRNKSLNLIKTIKDNFWRSKCLVFQEISVNMHVCINTSGGTNDSVYQITKEREHATI